MIDQLRVTKDKNGTIGLQINNIAADPAQFKTTDNLLAAVLAMDKYHIDEKDFYEIYNILKHIH